MGMPLSMLEQVMSGEELGLHWGDYLRQPWGPMRDELNTASITQAVWNSAGKTLKEPRPIEDFLTYSKPAVEQQPTAEPDPIEWMRQHGR